MCRGSSVGYLAWKWLGKSKISPLHAPFLHPPPSYFIPSCPHSSSSVSCRNSDLCRTYYSVVTHILRASAVLNTRHLIECFYIHLSHWKLKKKKIISVLLHMCMTWLSQELLCIRPLQYKPTVFVAAAAAIVVVAEAAAAVLFIGTVFVVFEILTSAFIKWSSGVSLSAMFQVPCAGSVWQQQDSHHQGELCSAAGETEHAGLGLGKNKGRSEGASFSSPPLHCLIYWLIYSWVHSWIHSLIDYLIDLFWLIDPFTHWLIGLIESFIRSVHSFTIPLLWFIHPLTHLLIY